MTSRKECQLRETPVALGTSHMITGLGNGLNSFSPKHRDMPQEVYTKQIAWFAKTENQICAPFPAWKG